MPIAAQLDSGARDPHLYNKDLAPIPLEHRTWGTYNYASLWVAMSVCIPTYMLASGLIAGGMSWWQAILTILLGNLIVLVPMLLNAHAGAKYGIPFPVLVRASFGVRGRMFRRCCVPWCLRVVRHSNMDWRTGHLLDASRIMWPGAAGMAGGIWICFFAFWALNIAVIWRGIDTIKFLEGIGAPFMLGIGLLLLWWITRQSGRLRPGPERAEQIPHLCNFFVSSFRRSQAWWDSGPLWRSIFPTSRATPNRRRRRSWDKPWDCPSP